MQVALRTDASGRIGTGHFRRCQSLASALRALGAQTLFVSRPHDAISLATAQEETTAWLPTPAPGFQPAPGDPPHGAWAGVGWEQDVAETLEALGGRRIDWLVVDHYAFDARWHAAVAGATGARIAVIDDLADRPLAADLLVDHNLQPDAGDKYASLLPSAARRLLGPRYAMLAPAYATTPRYHFRRHVRSIGVFLSGGSAASLAPAALEACRSVAGFQGEVELVASASSPHLEALQDAAARWPPARVLTDLPDLRAFFARHDLQIGSGGGAAWERCCVGAPTVAIQIAENQGAVLPGLEQLGALVWARPAGREPLGRAVRDLLQAPRARLALTRAGRRLVDGLGAARVAAVLALSLGPQLRLRAVTPADKDLLLAWANDPEVRRQSFRGDLITDAEHAAWFAGRLAAPDRHRILIAVAPNGVPVGQVRLNRGEHHWALDYLLDPAFRGLGLARAMVAQALGAVAAQAASPRRVRALVKPGNVASVRVFRALGFDEAMVEGDAGPCHELTLDLPGTPKHEDR